MKRTIETSGSLLSRGDMRHSCPCLLLPKMGCPCLANALPFSYKPAAEPAPRFYTMSLRRDCQLQRLVRQHIERVPASVLNTMNAPAARRVP